MPEALVYIAPTLFGAGGSAALVTATGTLTGLGIATSLASSLLLSAAASALTARSAPTARPENVKLNIKQSTGDRIAHVGRVRAGGTLVFFRTKSGRFFRVVVHGHGPIDGIEAYYLDGEPVTIDGAGNVTTARYLRKGTTIPTVIADGKGPLIRILTRTGAVPSTYYSEIEDEWPAWDEDHRLDGLWTSLTIAESVDPASFREVYPNGEPPIEIVARAAPVYDPRADDTAWSDNAALVIAYLLTSPDAFGLDWSDIDSDMAEEAADDCDVTVALAAGGSEPTWRIWGSYALTEPPADVLQRMLNACAGQVRLMPSGKIGIEVGKARTPDVMLTSAELIAIDDWRPGPDVLDRYTEATFRYLDPGLGYQPNTGGAWIDATREAAEGQALVGPEFDYIFAPSSTQGDRLIQQQIERDNPAHIVTARFRPSARRAIYETVVGLDVPELPSATWRVRSWSRDMDTGQITLTLWSYAHPTWSNTLEGVPQALPEPDEDRAVPAPENVVAAGAGVVAAQNVRAAAIGVVWDARPSQALTIRMEYSVAGADEWQAWPLSPDEVATRIAPLEDGADYDVRLWFETADGRRSAYATVEDVTALADADAPASATGLTVTDLTGGVARIAFTTSAAAGLWKTEVRRGATLIATLFAGSHPPSTPVTLDDASGAGSFTWTVRSINVSAIANAADASASQTIT